MSWPVYAAHTAAACFNCEGPLADAQPSHYAEGQGAQKAHCRRCGLFTYYDLRQEDPCTAKPSGSSASN